MTLSSTSINSLAKCRWKLRTRINAKEWVEITVECSAVRRNIHEPDSLNFSSSHIKKMKKKQVKIILMKVVLLSITILSTFQHGINTKLINGCFIFLSLN